MAAEKTAGEPEQQNSVQADAARPYERRTDDAVAGNRPPKKGKVDRKLQQMQLCGQVRASRALHHSGWNLRMAIHEYTDCEQLKHSGAICGELTAEPYGHTLRGKRHYNKDERKERYEYITIGALK